MSASVRRLDPSEWRLLREARLRALRDAPAAFESRFEEQREQGDDWWIRSASARPWFVATDGPQTVGMVSAVPAEGDDRRRRTVISMWVAPDHRGTGTAQALVEALATWATADGATSLASRVAAENHRARRFFERLGFRPTDLAEPGGTAVPGRATVDLCLTLPTARLRFGPSPAGDLHVGHVRTAALTSILARQLAGRYFVRFENTDRAKEVPGSRAAILADLAWLGLQGSETPRDQADLTDSHRVALDRLRSRGHTYLDDGAVRFRIPPGATVEWDDLARGPITVGNADVPDPVLVRSSGAPTFYLASAVDDADDGITHLVRVDSLVRATAAQIHIWRALGTEPPRVAHISRMAGVRTGSTVFTIRALRERGIDAPTLLAYLVMPATASWKPPPAGVDELVERVNLRRLARRPMVFDLRALDVMNRRAGDRATTAVVKG